MRAELARPDDDDDDDDDVSSCRLLLKQTLAFAPPRLFNLANSSRTLWDGCLLSLDKASKTIFVDGKISF